MFGLFHRTESVCDSLGIQISHTEKSREITASEEGQTGRAFVRVNYNSSYFLDIFLKKNNKSLNIKDSKTRK